jgi:micrococcal nuclease
MKLYIKTKIYGFFNKYKIFKENNNLKNINFNNFIKVHKNYRFLKKFNKITFYFLLLISVLILFLQISCSLIYAENIKDQSINKNNKGNFETPSTVLKDNANSSQTENSKSDFSDKENQTEFSNNKTDSTSKEDALNQSELYENEDFKDPGFTVVKVIDGDTIELKNKMRIRLIGINTPEKDMYFYEEAKEFMKILVQNKQVKLERDVTNKDIYGRYLRYVYLPDLFVNLEMIRCGFANAYTYPPDVKYTYKFLEAERAARENEAGLWQKSPTEVLNITLNYDAEGKDTENLNGEWVSIKNIGLKSLYLNGWTLKDAGTNIYKFKNIIIKPQETVFLYTGFGKDTNEKLYWNSDTPVWNNEHDTLYLRDEKGFLVYIYNY